MLDLQDFPGQGTALVGILNAFMESKGLIEPDELARILFGDRTARALREVHLDNRGDLPRKGLGGSLRIV